VFRIDAVDHERFAAAVTGRLADFADTWDDISPAGFAAVAWRIAVDLQPPYVKWPPRVISATCRRNTWDGTLTAEVTLAGRWPAELTTTRQWTRDRGWRDWPQTFGQYLTPTDHDLARAPHLRTLLLIETPVGIGDLPAAPAGPAADVVPAARHAVAVLARELTDLLRPLITQLDAGLPADT
jgi:hypothetical protein